METPLSTLLAQITPKSLFQILEIYTQAWAKGIDTPLIGFGLHSGQEIAGELVHIDFPTERLVMRIAGEEGKLHISFLDFRHIQHFTLFGLDASQDFLGLW